MKPQLTTVYIPTKVEDELPELYKRDIKDSVFAINKDEYKFIADTIRISGKLQDEHDYPSYAEHWLKEQKAIVFTSEEYNQHIQDVIKDALNKAADEAKVSDEDCRNMFSMNHVDEESIINTFDKTFKRFKHE